MCAVCAVLSQLVIPTPFGIPITLQTFVFALTGYILGIKGGLAVTLLYILMGALGIPVFSGFRGGIGCIFGDPTGGFIIGFIPLTLLCSVRQNLYFAKKGKALSAAFGFIGVILCHLCGASFYSVITRIPFFESCIIVCLPFILKDFIFCFTAYLLSGKIIKALKHAI